MQDHSYIVSTPMGEMRRNRHLMQILVQFLDSENSDSRPEQTPQEIIVPIESTSRSTTRSGCVSVPPNWLIADPHWNT